MKLISWTLAIVAAIMIARPAASESVNFYLSSCKNFTNSHFDKDPFMQGVCVGLLEGLATFAKDLPQEASRSCPPDNVDGARLTKAVVDWLDARPQRWTEDFRTLSLLALHDAWPCK